MKILYYYKLFVGFIFFCVFILFSTLYLHKETTISEILNKYTSSNINKYESAYHYNKMISKTVNKSLIQTPTIINILKNIEGATPQEILILRQKLHNHFIKSYTDLKELNFRQFHFYLKDNTSLLRMHQPDKYGDDLTSTRYGVTLVNKYLKPIDGFEEGKIISAFRFIYPIMDDKGEHIGSVEISVDSLGMIHSMKDYFKQNIHFIIKKDVVDKKIWKNELKKSYKTSIESPLYYMENFSEKKERENNHSILQEKSFFKNIQKKLKDNKAFSLYVEQQIVSFIPIKNIENNYVAYFVIYTDDDEIYNVLHIYWILNSIILFLLIITLYILHKDYKYRVLTVRTNETLTKRVNHEIQKNKNQALRNYITLFNTIPQAAVIIDPRTAKFVDINNATLNKYGFTKEEILTMNIYDLDITGEKNINTFFEQFKKGILHNFETVHIKKDKTTLNVIVNMSQIIIAKKIHYLLVATNITELKRTQQELQFHRDTLQTIVYILHELITHTNFNQAVEKSLKKIVYTLNIDRVYIFQNEIHGEKVLCSQKFEFAKEHISKEVHNRELQNIPYDEAGLQRWHEEFNSYRYIEGLVKDFSGYEKSVLESQDIKSILAMPIWDDDTLWGFIEFDDCTDERVWHTLEKDVLKSLCYSFISAYKKEKFADELQQQVTTQLEYLREKDEQLLQQSKLAQMGDMISMIAHQWRQPLNTISATSINLSLLSSMHQLTDEKIQQDALFLQDQCQKMSATIDTFINFIKPSKESHTFYLKHTIDSVLQIMGSQLENHNILIQTKLLNKETVVTGYEDLLEQVIINILSNARDAFDERDISQKNITITIDIVDTLPTITIEDNAGGIPTTIQDKIFNPYFTTREQGSGIGIGLYMSIDIMKKRFNGTLQYKETQEGSRFSIIIGGGAKINSLKKLT